ncbi:MAG: transcription antitermination factor NusB [Atribacterota bacterium]
MADRYRLDALSLLVRLDEGKVTFLDQAYTACSREYTPHERDLLVSLVRGVVKFRCKIDAVARKYLPRWERLPYGVQNALRLGIFQLLFHTHVPPFAAVYEWVEVVKAFGYPAFAALVNAVLRSVARDLEAYRTEASTWGVDIPSWLEREWKEAIGDAQLSVLLRSLALPPPLFVRVNTLQVGEEELQNRLAQRGIPSRKTSIQGALEVVTSYSTLVRTPEYAQGLFYPQDLGSQIVGHLVRPEPGECVVDACCGVGGKTLLLAQLMGNRGRILAWDRNKKRVAVMERLLKRTGVTIVQPGVYDCLKLPEHFWGIADRVLLDAPCSNLGTLRRNPEVLLRVREEDVASCAEKQLGLLRALFQVVKPGGLMVYSVCTLTRKETIEVVSAFEEEKGPKIARVQLGDGCVRGGEDGYVFLWPHEYFCDGFFVAAWRKVE